MTQPQRVSPCPVDLGRFDNRDFDRGARRWTEFLWRIVSALVFEATWLHAPALKRGLLRLFGAEVGRGVVVKPCVRITFPWKLRLGANSWLGESSWLLNLERISIGSNCCISQRAFLCTGNHDYKSETFDLITEPVEIRDGAWVGAAAFVAPGVRVGECAVVAAGSVVTGNVEPFTVCAGNPARALRKRSIGQRDAEPASGPAARPASVGADGELR